MRHATERDPDRILEIEALSFKKTWNDTAFRMRLDLGDPGATAP